MQNTPIRQSIGMALTQLYYSSNMSALGLWFFYPCDYTLETTHYYDEGFGVRMAEYGYNAANKIEEYQKTVLERFMRIYGLRITYSISSYSSVADACKTEKYGSVNISNLDGGAVNNSQIASCNHSTTHLTTEKLNNALLNGTNKISRVIWTGHEMINNEPATSYFNSQTIVMTPNYIFIESRPLGMRMVSSNRMDELFICLLMHELSHQLGTPDHYCKRDGNPCSNEFCDSCRNISRLPCLMTHQNNYLHHSDSDLYCSDCVATIKNSRIFLSRTR